MSIVGYVGLGVAVVVIVLLIVFYLWVYRRNRAEGSAGLVTRSRLTCPKCNQTFDFDYVPGASLTAIRLGTSRYMACPLCHKWSTFDLVRNRIPAPPPNSS
ncbi:MAG: hypothetical protein ACREDE_03295 [Thermoplasmata archaeon]